jgi:hypothetical protein
VNQGVESDGKDDGRKFTGQQKLEPVLSGTP